MAQLAAAILIPTGGLATATLPPDYQRDDEIFFQFHQALDCTPEDQQKGLLSILQDNRAARSDETRRWPRFGCATGCEF
jgi:hypothetical protein